VDDGLFLDLWTLQIRGRWVHAIVGESVDDGSSVDDAPCLISVSGYF